MATESGGRIRTEVDAMHKQCRQAVTTYSYYELSLGGHESLAQEAEETTRIRIRQWKWGGDLVPWAFFWWGLRALGY